MSLKKRIAGLIPKIVRKWEYYAITMSINSRWDRISKSDQILLSLKYRELLSSGAALPKFNEIGWQNFSQTDDDGILHYIFTLIGTVNRTAVEICAGDSIESNCANLVIHHGWRACFVDGNSDYCARARQFYSSMRETYISPPAIEHAWVDVDSVNGLLKNAGFSGEIDFFSLDMDGVDYWIWEAITEIQPRVVMAEYNSPLGGDVAWTVPYRRDFSYTQDNPPYYCGVTLMALVKLAKKKNYRLVGCNRDGFNAFFIRNDVGLDIFPEVSPQDCVFLPADIIATNIKTAKGKGEWVEV
jgi:hypothetical protein